MRKNKSLAVVSEDSLITKIINNLKIFLKFKQEHIKEESTNRKAVVIKEEKIERKIKKNITVNELNQIEEKISKDITYIENLSEDELNLLNDYYDIKINELENVLNDKKSNYFKIVSSKRV